MNFDVGVSACGAIGDNQARKLDIKRVYTHVKTIFNANLLGIPELSPMLLLSSRYIKITCTVKLTKYA
jgi:hypothetical protein